MPENHEENIVEQAERDGRQNDKAYLGANNVTLVYAHKLCLSLEPRPEWLPYPV
jgi:hypothetical protein